ncbi:MAG: hypothetical protein AAGI34_13650 [Pseudomonadota bacterium]
MLRIGGLVLALAVAACGAPQPSGKDDALAAARERRAQEAREAEATRHPEARFLVDYGGAAFRVNVRYVALIDESVIAVRRGAKNTQGWQRLAITPGVAIPEDTPFGDPIFARVAVDIADSVQKQPPICTDGQTMRLATDENDEARTLYRQARRVWVVFALCPEPATAPPS